MKAVKKIFPWPFLYLREIWEYMYSRHLRDILVGAWFLLVTIISFYLVAGNLQEGGSATALVLAWLLGGVLSSDEPFYGLTSWTFYFSLQSAVFGTFIAAIVTLIV
jgi:hypothetical protein